MVLGRFWSTFSHFDEEALRDGCDQIRAEARRREGGCSGGNGGEGGGGQAGGCGGGGGGGSGGDGGSGGGMLRFEDRLVFITAKAPTANDGSAEPLHRGTAELPAPPPLPLSLRIARDGFASPIRVLSREEAAEALAELEAYEAEYGEQGRLGGDARFKIHLLLPWAARLVRHPALVAAAQEALGTKDILVWSSDVNDKPPHSATYASAHQLSPSTGLPLWNTDEEMRPQAHQDSTYAGLLPADGALTAWVALSDAPVEAGCK